MDLGEQLKSSNCVDINSNPDASSAGSLIHVGTERQASEINTGSIEPVQSLPEAVATQQHVGQVASPEAESPGPLSSFPSHEPSTVNHGDDDDSLKQLPASVSIRNRRSSSSSIRGRQVSHTMAAPNGMNPGPGAPYAPGGGIFPNAGHHNDVQHIWRLVEELSQALQTNREKYEELQASINAAQVCGTGHSFDGDDEDEYTLSD